MGQWEVTVEDLLVIFCASNCCVQCECYVPPTKDLNTDLHQKITTGTNQHIGTNYNCVLITYRYKHIGTNWYQLLCVLIPIWTSMYQVYCSYEPVLKNVTTHIKLTCIDGKTVQTLWQGDHVSGMISMHRVPSV